MADLPRYSNTGDETATQADHDATPGRPSRTKVLLIIVAVLVVIVMVGLHLAGVTPH